MNEELKTYYMNNKRQILAILTALAVIFGALMLVYTIKGIKAISYVGKTPTSVNTISVAGKGEVIIKPDIATVSFSILEDNLDVSKATEAVNKKMDTAINSLKDMGVEEKDIKTTGYSIYPRYNYPKVYSSYYPDGGRVLAGYEVSQTVEIKIRNLDKAGSIISKLGELKVSNLNGLNFMVDKEDELKKDARNEAIKEARMEANKLASALGVRLGSVVGFTEDGRYPVYPMYEKSVMNQSLGMGSAGSDAVLPTGETKIISNVTIVYEIR